MSSGSVILSSADGKNEEHSADTRKRYDDVRTDVRTYAGLVVQVLTLLLTSIMLMMGWIAKDFLTEKYRLAVQASAPQLIANTPKSPTKPQSALPAPDGQAVHDTMDELHAASRTLWRLIIFSPMTSALLIGSCVFASLILGLFTVLCYQVQRRRYESHELAFELEMDDRQLALDPSLIAAGFKELAIILVAFTGFLFAFTCYQVGMYLSMSGVGLLSFLIAVFALLTFLKVICSFRMLFGYWRFEKRQSAKLRWRYARSITRKLKTMPVLTQNRELLSAIESLSAALERGSYQDHRHTIEPHIARLGSYWRAHSRYSPESELIEELAETLRLTRQLGRHPRGHAVASVDHSSV